MKSFVVSLTGTRHTANEDSYAFVRSRDGAVRFYFVADGMGGYLAGNVASRMTAEGFARACGELTYTDVPGLTGEIRRITEQINGEVAACAADPEHKNMGSTLVAAAVIEQENTVLFFHLGDSRGYLFDGENLRRITRDHSMAQFMIDMGYTPEDTKKYLFSNAVTKAVGYLARDGAPVQCDFYREPWDPDCRILLCTDGLSGAVSDEELAAIMREHRNSSCEKLCGALCEAARQAGSTDDITVMTVGEADGNNC